MNTKNKVIINLYKECRLIEFIYKNIAIKQVRIKKKML